MALSSSTHATPSRPGVLRSPYKFSSPSVLSTSSGSSKPSRLPRLDEEDGVGATFCFNEDGCSDRCCAYAPFQAPLSAAEIARTTTASSSSSASLPSPSSSVPSRTIPGSKHWETQSMAARHYPGSSVSSSDTYDSVRTPATVGSVDTFETEITTPSFSQSPSRSDGTGCFKVESPGKIPIVIAPDHMDTEIQRPVTPLLPPRPHLPGGYHDDTPAPYSPLPQPPVQPKESYRRIVHEPPKPEVFSVLSYINPTMIAPARHNQAPITPSVISTPENTSCASSISTPIKPIASRPTVSSPTESDEGDDFEGIDARWRNRLGHCNYSFYPRLYRPDTQTRESCLKLFEDWRAARKCFEKTDFTVATTYGASSNTCRLVRCKYAEIDAVWCRLYTELWANLPDCHDLPTAESQIPCSETSPQHVRMLEDLRGDKRMGMESEEQVVGPMHQAKPLVVIEAIYGDQPLVSARLSRSAAILSRLGLASLRRRLNPHLRLSKR